MSSSTRRREVSLTTSWHLFQKLSTTRLDHCDECATRSKSRDWSTWCNLFAFFTLLLTWFRSLIHQLF